MVALALVPKAVEAVTVNVQARALPMLPPDFLAALAGVMFMVVPGTFEWSSLRIIHKIPKPDDVIDDWPGIGAECTLT